MQWPATSQWPPTRSWKATCLHAFKDFITSGKPDDADGSPDRAGAQPKKSPLSHSLAKNYARYICHSQEPRPGFRSQRLGAKSSSLRVFAEASVSYALTYFWRYPMFMLLESPFAFIFSLSGCLLRCSTLGSLPCGAGTSPSKSVTWCGECFFLLQMLFAF